MRRTRPGHALALASGLLLATGILTSVNPAADAKAPATKTADSKAATDPKADPKKAADIKKPVVSTDKKPVPVVEEDIHFEEDRVINDWIELQWKKSKIRPAERATDYEFIRRASLDIIGRIPTIDEIHKFMSDPAQSRRSALIERLLDSPDYAENWANIWTTWLMTRSGQKLYHEQMEVWLEEQFSKKGQGWDKIVTELLTATGQNDDNGAVNFILSHLGEQIPQAKQKEEGQFQFAPITSRVTRLFLGVQIQCTQCHDHPFNGQWKQKHFWGINTFFRQTVRGGAPNMRNNNMMMAAKLSLKDDSSLNPDDAVYYENRKFIVMMTRAKFLDGKAFKSDSGTTRREQLADFVTHSDYFAKAYVNRMWGHFFSRGFTNPGPVDDFGEHNPVTHRIEDDEDKAFASAHKLPKEAETLLDYLAIQFRSPTYKHDPRQLIRWICNSRAYNLSYMANETNDKPDQEWLFSRMLLKAMSPEQLFESLWVSTYTGAKTDKDAQKKAKEALLAQLTRNFGDDEGNEVTFNGTVVQALILMNSQQINEAISHADGPVAKAMARGAKGGKPEDMIDEIYLAALSRKATPAEVAKIKKSMEPVVPSVIAAYTKNRGYTAEEQKGCWQDLFWALLNSSEFILNH